jgi:hypothetical protein
LECCNNDSGNRDDLVTPGKVMLRSIMANAPCWLVAKLKIISNYLYEALTVDRSETSCIVIGLANFKHDSWTKSI